MFLVSMHRNYTVGCLCLVLLFLVNEALSACVGTEVASLSSTEICCNETTRWCHTTNTIFNQDIRLESDYSLWIMSGHAIITPVLTVNGSLKIDANGYLYINTNPALISGSLIELGDGAELRLGKGGFLQIIRSGTCISVSPSAKLYFEFNSSHLQQTNYTVPIFESTAGPLCILGNTSFGSKSTVNLADTASPPPLAWSTNSTCLSESSMIVAFTISCPPTYATLEAYIADWSTYTPTDNGAPTISPSLLSSDRRPTPARTNANDVDALVPGLTFETTLIIVVVIIVSLGLVALIAALVIRYNKRLRKEAMPHHDREFFEKKITPYAQAPPAHILSINTSDVHLASAAIFGGTAHYSLQQTPSPKFENPTHQQRFDQITGNNEYPSTQQ